MERRTKYHRLFVIEQELALIVIFPAMHTLHKIYRSPNVDLQSE